MPQRRETGNRFEDRKPRRFSCLAWLSVGNLLTVLAVGALLQYWSEDWWFSTILVYAPKAPLAVPAAVLCLLSLLLRPRWFVVNAASLLLVLGPIMGFVAPISRWTEEPPTLEPGDLRVVSCNIQAFRPDFPMVVSEAMQFDPELIAFQEVKGEDHPVLAKAFAGWHVARHDEFWVASKYPVRFLQTLESSAFVRAGGLLVEVDLPTGTILVGNIHLMTARRSLAELSVGGLLSGEGPGLIVPHQVLRDQEMGDVRAQIEELRGGRPMILLGDFNTPVSSSLFQRWWTGMTSAYDATGFGWGYTSPCRPDHKNWFRNTPWVRIDHVLCSAEWQVVTCDIGQENGSDHRLIAAALRLPASQPVKDAAQAEVSDSSE